MFVDEDVVNDKIDLLGSTITITSYTGNTYNDYGDINLGTASITNTVAVVNALSNDDDVVKEGIFTPMDKRFFLKSTETISQGDIITHKNIQFKVDGEPSKHELEDNVYAIEAYGRRI